MTPQTERRLLAAIAIAYLLLGVIYSQSSPLFEVSDELWHYPMVQYLATNGLQLPPQDPANIGPWRQEGSQPPLYYMIAAVLTAGIDTSDMHWVRRINPHADIGIVRPDGNVNMITHRQASEAFPWSGTVLAVNLIRLFSILLGLGTVLVTYQLGRELFPDAPAVRLGAAALVAFLPMFLFVSASVNNDNLSNLLGNALTLLTVRLLKARGRPPLRAYVLLGLLTGAGLLAKFNIGFFIPIIALTLLLITVRLRDLRPLLFGGLISGALTIAIAGWWYWRNVQLYGDPTGLNRFLEIVGRRLIPANAAQLWSERDSFTGAFWGYFGGMNVPMPDAIYLIFNMIAGLGLVGALIFLISYRFGRIPPTYQLSNGLAAAVTLLWPLVTFISFLRWTAETPASQGRLMFGALASIMIWLVVGLTWAAPQRLRPWIIGGVVGYFALIAAAAPFAVIRPAYALPPAAESAETIALFAAEDTPTIALTDASIQTAAVTPGDYVLIDTDWRIEMPHAGRDWSLFVHLTTPDGVIISQRDVYPGRGLLATSDLAMGTSWVNPIAIWVPTTAYTPMMLDIRIGWYHLHTGERLRLPDGAELFTIGQIDLRAAPSPLDLPNPLNINFGGEIALLGYELTDLTPAPGETLTLTLYWRGLRPLDTDYKIFAHIIDPQTLTKYAASDAMPAGWAAPTSTWETGTLITDTHTLVVIPDALPGIYELEIGIYREADSERLRIITPDGGQADNFIRLSRVRIQEAAAP